MRTSITRRCTESPGNQGLGDLRVRPPRAMQRFAPQIDYYLEMFRRGNADNAFHGLLEMEHGILPELMAEFRAVTSSLIGIDSRGSLHVVSLPFHRT